MRAAAATPRPATSPMTRPSRPPGSVKASNQSPPTAVPSPPAEKCDGQRDAGRVGQPAGEQVALQGGGDRALALVGGLGLGAPGALLGEALARGLGAPALAQVVDLDEDREDLAVVLAHAPGEDRDREVLVAGELQLGGRRHRRAGQRGGQQRVEREAIVVLDQRADGHAVDRAAAR